MPLILLQAAKKAVAAIVAGTFAKFDTISQSPGSTISADGLTLTTASTTYKGARSTISVSTGKWYWEYLYVGGSSNNPMFGVGAAGVLDYQTSPSAFLYASGNSNYSTLNSSLRPLSGKSAIKVGNVIGVAYDADARSVNFYVNNVLYITIVLTTVAAGTPVYAVVGDGTSAGTTIVTANFGATSFVYSVPEGYNAGLFA